MRSELKCEIYGTVIMSIATKQSTKRKFVTNVKFLVRLRKQFLGIWLNLHDVQIFIDVIEFLETYLTFVFYYEKKSTDVD